jgi:hypothetical protein
MDPDPRELSPIERYEKRAAHFWEEVRRLEARSRGYSNLRLAIVVIGVVSAFLPKDNAFWVLLLTTLFLLLLVLFIAAVVRHQAIEARLRTSREMARRNEEGRARIARNWKDCRIGRLRRSSLVVRSPRTWTCLAGPHYSISSASRTLGKAGMALPRRCCTGSSRRILRIDMPPFES